MPKAKATTSPAKFPKVESDPVSLILPYLYLGPCSATSARSTFVARRRITHIISVGKRPNSTLDSVSYHRISIDDDPSADVCKAGREAVAFVHKARSEKKSSKIFIHCAAGISRSPAVVALYLMHSCGMTLKRALGVILGARPTACPNPGFIAQLQKAELELRGRSSFPPGFTSLPSKKEERLAFFLEEQEDVDVDMESSKPAPILDRASALLTEQDARVSNNTFFFLQTSQSNREIAHDKIDDHTRRPCPSTD